MIFSANRRPPERKVGVYVHIPFCRSKCLYCDFNSIALDERDPLAERYVEALRKEISLKFYSGAFRVETIFFGGGTPSILKTSELASIVDELASAYSIDSDVEMTIEINPESIDLEKARDLKSIGFNRASIGIQSLTDPALKFLRRAHDRLGALCALENIIAAKFENFSVDLIYNIPGQSRAEWVGSLREALERAPKHLSIYELTPASKTALQDMIDAKEITLDDDFADQLHHAAEGIMEAYSFNHYEISNYARAGFECRHNLKYWRSQEWIGFGLGAVGELDGIRRVNIAEIESYIKRIHSNLAPIAEAERIDPKTKETERVMMGLRLAEGIPDQPVQRSAKIEQMIADGALVRADGRIKTTPYGARRLDELLARIL